MCAWQVQAQEWEVEDKDDIFSKVRIDTIQIKGTPYERVLENGVWKDEDKQIDYYNDITIFHISKKETPESTGLLSTPRPAVFMIPGGGFFGYSSSDIAGMDLIGNKSLGSKLVDNLNVDVFLIYYNINSSTLLSSVVFPLTTNNCTQTQNQRGKALGLEASYKAFYDLRKILKVNYLDSAAIKNLDPSNFFLIGSSAGAVLALNTLFLQSNEIPSSISFLDNCSTSGFGTPITISSQVRNDFWPIPTIKGIVSMAGAWIYDNVGHLTTNPSTPSTPLLLMHGTCDELITRKEGNIGFKIIGNNFSQNVNNTGRFFNGKGSEFIFNAFKESHSKMIYSQVQRGTHGIFSTGTSFSNAPAAWDLIFDSNNLADPVTGEIQPFIQNLINGTSNILTYTKTMLPEKQSANCRNFDAPNDTICFYFIPTPNANYNSNICHTSTYTATLSGLPPAPISVVWSVSGNIQIVGSNTGSNVQYKSVNSSFASGIFKATITRGCSQKEFSFPVSVNANKLDDIQMTNSCYAGSMGTITRRYTAGNTLEFTSTYINAFFESVTALQWELLCGGVSVSSSTFNTMVGVNLVSTFSIPSPPAGCNAVRVRYQRSCGQLSNWFVGFLDGCLTLPPFSFSENISIHPNPSTDAIKLTVTEGTKLGLDYAEVIILDDFGAIVYKQPLSSLTSTILISNLRAGTYTVVLYDSNAAYYSTFIKI